MEVFVLFINFLVTQLMQQEKKEWDKVVMLDWNIDIECRYSGVSFKG